MTISSTTAVVQVLATTACVGLVHHQNHYVFLAPRTWAGDTYGLNGSQESGSGPAYFYERFDSMRAIQLYILIYMALVLLFCILLLARDSIFSFWAIRASTVLHNKLFKSVLNAPMLFLLKTPVGDVLNAFARDQVCQTAMSTTICTDAQSRTDNRVHAVNVPSNLASAQVDCRMHSHSFIKLARYAACNQATWASHCLMTVHWGLVIWIFTTVHISACRTPLMRLFLTPCTCH